MDVVELSYPTRRRGRPFFRYPPHLSPVMQSGPISAAPRSRRRLPESRRGKLPKYTAGTQNSPPALGIARVSLNDELSHSPEIAQQKRQAQQ